MLNGQIHSKHLAVAILVLYCLAFFRYDTTEKSMVRAVILEQGEAGWTAGLLYQAPEASADSSEAAAEIRFAACEGETLERALDGVQAALPHAASYRLCDYVLLAPGSGWAALEEYEAVVLKRQCGRTSASVSACSFGCEDLSALTEEEEGVLAEILQCVKDAESFSPYLYELHTQPALVLPQAGLEEGKAALLNNGCFLTCAAKEELAEDTLQTYYLMTGKSGQRTFWLDGQQVNVRRCTVSVTAHPGGRFALRIDCQNEFSASMPTGVQQEQLAGLCAQAIREFWEKGTDVLSLGAYAVQRYGPDAKLAPERDECPRVDVAVRFGSLL